MPNSPSARKRVRQNGKRRLRNRGRCGVVRALSRQVREADDGNDKGKAADAYKALQKRVDKVAASGTIHKRTASRIKSRLARRISATS